MKKIRILFIVLAIVAVNSRQLNSHAINQHLPMIRLRSFNIYQLIQLRDLEERLKTQRILEEDKERLEMRLQNEAIFKKALEQRKIYQKYLGNRKYNTNFLRDFNADRYF
jgi:hypothetical protein